MYKQIPLASFQFSYYFYLKTKTHNTQSVFKPLIYKRKTFNSPLFSYLGFFWIRRFPFQRNNIDPILRLFYSPPSAQPAEKQQTHVGPEGTQYKHYPLEFKSIQITRQKEINAVLLSSILFVL